VPAAALELVLEIARAVRDLVRIDERLSVLERRLLEPALRGRTRGERREQYQRGPDSLPP
jgi:hypothetical protein